MADRITSVLNIAVEYVKVPEPVDGGWSWDDVISNHEESLPNPTFS